MDCFYSHIFNFNFFNNYIINYFVKYCRVKSTSDPPTVITSVVAMGMEGVSQLVKKKISCPEAFSYLIVELKLVTASEFIVSDNYNWLECVYKT